MREASVLVRQFKALLLAVQTMSVSLPALVCREYFAKMTKGAGENTRKGNLEERARQLRQVREGRHYGETGRAAHGA